MNDERWIALVVMIVLMVVAVALGLTGGMFIAGAVITFMSGEVSAGLFAVVVGVFFLILAGVAGLGVRDFAKVSHAD